jgi:hypothetical protein
MEMVSGTERRESGAGRWKLVDNFLKKIVDSGCGDGRVSA